MQRVVGGLLLVGAVAFGCKGSRLRPDTDTPSATVSVAYFRGSQLDECDDFVVQPFAGGGAAATRAMVDDVTERLSGDNDKQAMLPTSCAEQFAGREVIATCSLPQLSSSQLGRVSFEARLYNAFTATTTDIHLQACLKAGGTWQVAHGHATANAAH